MKTYPTEYEINIRFNADHELTELELEALQLHISAQIEEPGEDCDYTVDHLEYRIKSAPYGQAPTNRYNELTDGQKLIFDRIINSTASHKNYGADYITDKINKAYEEASKDIYRYEYEIQGNYGYGWEMLTTESNIKDARAQLETYQSNENIPLRIKKVKVVK
jgi:hypothetical protein